MQRLLRLSLPLLAVLLASACSSTRYINSPPYPKTTLEVFGAVVDVLERQHFRIQSIENRSLITAVQIQLSPFNKQGTRRTAMVQIEATPEGTVVRLNVEKEVNTNITNPLDEHQADWSSTDDWGGTVYDTETEGLLLSLIGMKVMPPKIPAGARPRRRP